DAGMARFARRTPRARGDCVGRSAQQAESEHREVGEDAAGRAPPEREALTTMLAARARLDWPVPVRLLVLAALLLIALASAVRFGAVSMSLSQMFDALGGK